MRKIRALMIDHMFTWSRVTQAAHGASAQPSVLCKHAAARLIVPLGTRECPRRMDGLLRIHRATWVEP